MTSRSAERRSMTLPVRDSNERTLRGSSSSGRLRYVNGLEHRQGNSKNLLLIGIDYGTTFTSVAYIYIKDGVEANSNSLGVRLSSIEYITSWPAATETGGVPTTTLYSSPNNDTMNPMFWGYKVAKALERKRASPAAFQIRLAKLLLHEAKETEEETLRLKETAQKAGKAEIEFIGDFLSCLQKFLFGEDGFGGYFQEHHSSWLVDTKIELILGVPAAWSELEQQAMVQVAIQAGMENPSRGSEPEAMAGIFFAQHEASLRIGDAFVICDAGGGTVDLITYKVAELNPLRVNEASVAEGVLCGSTYLNQRFRNLLKERLTTEVYLRGLDDILDRATLRFDLDTKIGFDGTDGESFLVPGLRDDPARGFEDDRLWLSCEEMRDEVFDPIVQQIIDIIRRQIQSSKDIAKAEHEKLRFETRGEHIPLKIKNIVLGGGFANNPYLSRTIRRTFFHEPTLNERIEVQQLSSGSTTVAKGLVLMASRYGLVKQRRSRLNYGIFTYIEYDERLHGSKDVCEPVNDIFVRGEDNPKFIKVVDWLVRKGQPLSQEAYFTRTRDKRIGYKTLELNEIIYVSDSDTSEDQYTLLKDLPAGCTKYKISTSIVGISKEETFVRTGKNSFTVFWDVNLSIKHNEMIWAVVLKPEFGEHIVTTHSPILFDADENKTRILGSLASRWTKEPVKPTSQFPRQPLFSRKRSQGGNHSPRKSTRLSVRNNNVVLPSIEADIDAAIDEENNPIHGNVGL